VRANGYKSCKNHEICNLPCKLRVRVILRPFFNAKKSDFDMSKVKLTTNHGDIVLELNAEKAPLTVANFIEYVNAGHYENTIFHRVIGNFMIQGGGFEPGMKEKKDKRPSIKNEADNGLPNKKYSIAMARTMEPHSASAQFFINVADNSFLNHTAPNTQGWGYAVFGEVIEGTDVVDKIKGVATGSKAGHQDVPSEDVIIEKAEIVE
jgi:peptidyl-prolyl cis-trans isomerase B (cyclophilin B)